MMSEQLEGKYLILKDESVIHWMTGVVLFGFEKLQHNSYQFVFKYLFTYLFIYIFFYFIYLLKCIDNLCIITMFACLDYDLYM